MSTTMTENIYASITHQLETKADIPNKKTRAVYCLLIIAYYCNSSVYHF